MLLLTPLGRATGEQYELFDDFRHVLRGEIGRLRRIRQLLRPACERGAQEGDHLVPQLRVVVNELLGVPLVGADSTGTLVILALGGPVPLTSLVSHGAEAHAVLCSQGPDTQVTGDEFLLKLVVVNFVSHGSSLG